MSSIIKRSMDYDDAFEITGQGRFNHLVLVACSFIFMYCSLEMAGMAYVITPAECDLQLTLTEKSMISSGIFIGIVTTSICWGELSDLFGRRRIILPAVLCTIITSFLSSISTAFWAMFPLRVLTGMFVAASTSTVLVYLGELHTMKYRDFALSIAITSDQVNFVILPGIAYLITRGTWSFEMGSILVKPWRVFMWTWCSFGIIGASILCTLPESPRYIVASEGAYRALPILADIYAINKKKTPADYPIHMLRSSSSVLRSSHATIKSILLDMTQLLRPPIRRCYLITHYCIFMAYFLTNGLYIWMPPFINDAIKDLKQKCSVCDMINKHYIENGAGVTMFQDLDSKENCDGDFNPLMYPISIGMEFAFLIPYMLVIYLIDKVNLQKLYAYIAFMCAGGLFVCCWVPQVVVSMVALTIGLCTGSMVSILAALAIDTFPTSLRALAMCTMEMMGQAGAIIGVSVISLMQGFLCHVVFLIIISALIGSAVVLLKYWPDLRQVRSEMERRQFTY